MVGREEGGVRVISVMSSDRTRGMDLKQRNEKKTNQSPPPPPPPKQYFPSEHKKTLLYNKGSQMLEQVGKGCCDISPLRDRHLTWPWVL